MTTEMLEALRSLKDSQGVSGTKRQAEKTEEAMKKVDRAAKK